MPKLILSLFVIFTLCSCAHNRVLFKPWGTEEQTVRDLALCKQASYNPYLTNFDYQEQILNCLYSLGYKIKQKNQKNF